MCVCVQIYVYAYILAGGDLEKIKTVGKYLVEVWKVTTLICILTKQIDMYN